MIIPKGSELTSYSPKNYDDVFEIVAKELGVDEKLVRFVTTDTQKKIRTSISNAEATKIKIRRLGTFSTKPSTIDRNIRLWIKAYREYKIPRKVACSKISELWRFRVLWQNEIKNGR